MKTITHPFIYRISQTSTLNQVSTSKPASTLNNEFESGISRTYVKRNPISRKYFETPTILTMSVRTF